MSNSIRREKEKSKDLNIRYDQLQHKMNELMYEKNGLEDDNESLRNQIFKMKKNLSNFETKENRLN